MRIMGLASPIIEQSGDIYSSDWRASMGKVSMAWHRFLVFPSALETPPKRGTWAAAAIKEATEEEFRRWKRMQLVDVDAQLRVLVGYV